MSLQRQHLKTLSVGPARVWTRELPLSRPVEQARRRSQQRSMSCLLYRPQMDISIMILSLPLLEFCIRYSLQAASSSFRVKSEVPWVPEVFLAYGGNFRAEGRYIFGRRPKPRAVMKTWQKPETAVEKSLAPRVRAKRAAREFASEMDGRKEPWQRIKTWFLATLSEDRFLCLWEITLCRLCGCFQRFNLEALSPRIGTENLTVKAEGSVMYRPM